MSSSVDTYAVIGQPVEHSRSPFIHQRFAEATQQRLRYLRIAAPVDGFAATLQRFATGHDDDGAAARGANITVPFKFEARALAATLTPRAALAGAVNTLRFDADGWFADNTDGIGLRRDIELNAGVPLAGRQVLLIGAGGAAAGALGPLIEGRPARLVISNRSAGKAAALVARHAAWAHQHGVALLAAPLDAAGEAFDVVVNATAASLHGEAIGLTRPMLAPGALALDMMYGDPARPFLEAAEALGARGRDGLGMLVEQAAEAFALWRGVRPQTAPVLAALREHMAVAG